MSTDTTGHDPEEWMSTAEAAKALGCSPSTVLRRITAGELQWRRHQGNYRVLRSQIEAWVGQPRLAMGAAISSTMRDDLEFRLRYVFGWTELELVMTQPEVAIFLNVDVRQVRRSVKDGSLPSMRIGARDMVPTHALLEQLCRTSAA
jgi:excisionase family DNA binding protein